MTQGSTEKLPRVLLSFLFLAPEIVRVHMLSCLHFTYHFFHLLPFMYLETSYRIFTIQNETKQHLETQITVLYRHRCEGLPLDKLPINLDAAKVLVGQAGEGSRGEIDIVRTAAWTFVNYSGLNRFSIVVNIDLLESAVTIPVFRAVKSDDEISAFVSATASSEPRIIISSITPKSVDRTK